MFSGETKVAPYPKKCPRIQEVLRAILLFIVRGMHALSIVDDPHFNALIAVLDPRVVLPCRSTITNTHLPILYKEAVQKLSEELSRVEFVALTSDSWTCRNNRHYLTVTVHFVNFDMKLVSRVLVTVHMDESCTCENLASRLKEIAKEWGIMDKVIAVVTDNAANMVGAVNLISSTHPGWRQIPCFAHTLSLVVKGSILKNIEFFSIVTRARAIVTFFHQSTKATAKLAALCKEQTKKVLQQDVETRWNSTLIMISSLLELKEFVQDALCSPVINRKDLDLTDFEWETLYTSMGLLLPFEELTRDLSSQLYPSLSKVVPSVKLIQNFLATISPVTYAPCLIELIESLREEMNRRFGVFNTAHLISTYLDPR